MIIPNGYISFRLSGATGLDNNGYPTLSPDAWGNKIECQYLPSVNLRARGNNEAYTAHSYTVYVEQMTVPSEIVKLYDMNECEIGQFSMRSIEQLDAVCQTKITL